jgi:hypothetical protein
MTSWANMKAVSLKKKEPTIRSFFSTPSDDVAATSLYFLYGFLYSQRNAEPYYIHDTKGFLQPILKTSPIVHYLKEAPSSGTNFAEDVTVFGSIVNALTLVQMKRTISSIYQFNDATLFKIDAFLSSFGLLRQSIDAGIVLDISGCVPTVVNGLKTLQKRIGKKQMRIFVMTDNLELLREFAAKGDSTWSFVSLNRTTPPTTSEGKLIKFLAELKLMQQAEYLAFRFGSPLGKLLFLTSEKVGTESQVIAVDGQKWKAM